VIIPVPTSWLEPFEKIGAIVDHNLQDGQRRSWATLLAGGSALLKSECGLLLIPWISEKRMVTNVLGVKTTRARRRREVIAVGRTDRRHADANQAIAAE